MSNKAAKRRAKRGNRAAATTPTTQTSGGLGGRSARTDTGLTGIKDARMEQMAIRRGWIKGQRWPTDATPEDFQQVQQERSLTLRERVTLSAYTDAMSKDARIRQIAVKSVVAMEGQNQRDEIGGDNDQPNVQVNVAVAGVQMSQVPNDPDYLEYLESKRLEGCRDAAAVGGANIAEPVPGGKASTKTESSSNGHTNGNGWHPPFDGDGAAAAW